MRKNFGAKPWTYPQPVFILAAYDENGTPNAMNAAWGGTYDNDQVVLCLSPEHKTTQNILARKAFVVSMADAAHAAPCDYVGIVSGNKVADKVARAGFHTEKSKFVDAPVIQELGLAMECEFVKTTEDGQVIGRVVNVSADESVLGADGKVDPEKLNVILYDGIQMTYRAVGPVVAQAFSAGKTLK